MCRHRRALRRERVEEEEMRGSATLSRKEEAKRCKCRWDEDGGNTCSGRVHAFQGFRERARNMTAVTSA